MVHPTTSTRAGERSLPAGVRKLRSSTAIASPPTAPVSRWRKAKAVAKPSWCVKPPRVLCASVVACHPKPDKSKATTTTTGAVHDRAVVAPRRAPTSKTTAISPGYVMRSGPHPRATAVVTATAKAVRPTKVAKAERSNCGFWLKLRFTGQTAVYRPNCGLQLKLRANLNHAIRRDREEALSLLRVARHERKQDLAPALHTGTIGSQNRLPPQKERRVLERRRGRVLPGKNCRNIGLL